MDQSPSWEAKSHSASLAADSPRRLHQVHSQRKHQDLHRHSPS